MNTADQFPRHKGYKTEQGAFRHLQRVLNQLQSKPNAYAFVQQRTSDKRWLPIVVISDGQLWLATFFASNNVCSTDRL